MRKKIELTIYILSFMCIIFGILLLYNAINTDIAHKSTQIVGSIVFILLYLFASIMTYIGTKKKNIAMLILGIFTYNVFSITNMILFIRIMYINAFFILIGISLIILSALNLGILTKNK